MDTSIQETIVGQMGGYRAMTMIGTHRIVFGDRLVVVRFKARAKGKVNTIRVHLDYSDTYTVTFDRVTNGKLGFRRATVAMYSDIYADQLVDLIERETGLYLSL